MLLPEKTSRAGYTDPIRFLPPILLLGFIILLVLLWPSDAELPTADSDAAATATDSESSDEDSTDDDDLSAPPEEPTLIDIETSLGTIRAKLYTKRAPKTAQNFKDLVEQNFYDGIIFHRVIKDFMVQTGDPTGTGMGGRQEKGLPAKQLMDEFHPELKHDRAGLLSMANSGANTGDTQFFITARATPHLDNKHAIFGEVVDGMDVVRAIENVETNNPTDNRPLDPPKMIKVRVVKPDDGAAPDADPSPED